jgi:hypothetical protein
MVLVGRRRASGAFPLRNVCRSRRSRITRGVSAETAMKKYRSRSPDLFAEAGNWRGQQQSAERRLCARSSLAALLRCGLLFRNDDSIMTG